MTDVVPPPKPSDADDEEEAIVSEAEEEKSEKESVLSKRIQDKEAITREEEQKQCWCFTGRVASCCISFKYFLIGRPETLTPLEDELEDDLTRPYEPGEHRRVKYKTTDFETCIHLIKSLSGAGILTMPRAFYHSGLIFGILFGLPIGMLCMYCMYMVVSTSQYLQRKLRIPAMGYGKTCRYSCEEGGFTRLYKYGTSLHRTVDILNIINLIFLCSSFIIFVASNVKQVVDKNVPKEYHFNIRLYMLFQYPVLLLLNSLRHLRFLTPFVVSANLTIWTALILSLTFMLRDLPPISEVRLLPWSSLGFFIFVVTIIFATAGCCLVLPLEEVMKKPSHMVGCPCSVLSVASPFVQAIYFTIGFIGFWKYGEETETNLTLNINVNSEFGESIKILMSFGVLMSYCTVFYIAVNICWGIIHTKCPNEKYEWLLRYSLITLTVLLAAGFADFEVIISLIGATILPFLEVIIPTFIYFLVLRHTKTRRYYFWTIYKTFCIVLLGIVVFLLGTFFATINLINFYMHDESRIREEDKQGIDLFSNRYL